MMRTINWAIIILAVSLFGCSNPTADTAATTGPTTPIDPDSSTGLTPPIEPGSSTGPTTPPSWEMLLVKFEVSGVVAFRGDSRNDNMAYHKYDKNGYDGRWDSSISFNSKIDESWKDTNSDPPTNPYIYNTKEVVVYWAYPQSLRVSVGASSGGRIKNRDSDDYLITKIYVKKADTDDYTLYKQNNGQRRSRYNELQVAVAADLINYR